MRKKKNKGLGGADFGKAKKNGLEGEQRNSKKRGDLLKDSDGPLSHVIGR